ncbi:conserved hypothetical protein [Neisseria gonorrhoeae 1291]|nr:conserved hypothetical protein [Neisseria gonorrhoeae 1291]
MICSRENGNPGHKTARSAPPMPVTHFPTSARRNYGNTRTVIPAQAGIRCVEFQLFRITFETLIPSFPRKWESGFLSFSHSR